MLNPPDPATLARLRRSSRFPGRFLDGRIALRALGLAAGLTGTDGARAGARSSAMGCGWEGCGGGCGGCGGCGCGCGWGLHLKSPSA